MLLDIALLTHKYSPSITKTLKDILIVEHVKELVFSSMFSALWECSHFCIFPLISQKISLQRNIVSDDGGDGF